MVEGVEVPGVAIMVIGGFVVGPTFESVAVLGMIVVIRIVLSFDHEVKGTWPWSRWHLDTQKGCQVDGDPLQRPRRDVDRPAPTRRDDRPGRTLAVGE